MKNRQKFFIYFLFLLIFTFDTSISNDFELDSKLIEFDNEGKIITATGEVEINVENGIVIKSDKSILNKQDSILEASGNVYFYDEKNKIEIFAENIKYEKKKNIIFFNNENKIIFDNKYSLRSKDIIYNKNKNIIYSNYKSSLKDKNNNNIFFDNFNFDVIDKVVDVENLQLIDTSSNKYKINEAMINLNYEEFIGKNVKIFFYKEIFGDSDNDPRLFGNSVIHNKDETLVNKGIFTSCKINNDEDCPPWLIKADQVKHNKKNKTIEYKNAWLNVYDFPLIYFPYFYHPDPTVKRQSGFLLPKLSNSSTLGNSLQIPYYKVISDNKDLTLSPKIFFDDNILIQTEYRQKNKNSELITDQSINFNDNSTRSHFFGNFKTSTETSEYQINLESTSNKNYLKKYEVVSPLIDDNMNLNSFISFEKDFDDSYFSTSFEVFEDLTKDDTDSYEYIYPNYYFNKQINSNKPGSLEFSTSGYQKKYDTSKYDAVVVNDIKYRSLQNISRKGSINNFSFVLKNLNTDGENSTNHDNSLKNKFLASVQIDTKHPMKKETDSYLKYLTPKASFKFSPTETKNVRNDEISVNYLDLFNINRFNDNQMLEGGESITLGLDYTSRSKKNDKGLGLSIGQVYRVSENNDLPEASSLGQSRSDFIGNLSYNHSEKLNINYSFAIDNNFQDTNYDFVETSLSLNKFITSFKFLNTNKALGDKSFISNTSKIKFNKEHSLNFTTNKNLDENYTEYYDLIYEYKNDCFAASVEYKKSFYKDVDISAGENIMFSIKIIPFGKINTLSLN